MRRRMIDDRLLSTVALRERFMAEACFEEGNGMYQGFGLRDGGIMVNFNSGVMAPPVDDMQQMFAHVMLHALNKEIHHDGAWVVLFTHPTAPVAGIMMPGAETIYGRLAFLWMDADGDVQFTNDCISDFITVALEGPLPWIEKNEQAWVAWDHFTNKVLERGEGDSYKRALGEAAPSAGKGV